MPETRKVDVTAVLLAWNAGDPGALEKLVPLVYEELRRLARARLRREREGHTLQTTALVHEAYLRLVDRDRVSWKDRAHFFGAAAAIMRRVLTDHARTRLSAKRGGAAIRLALDDGLGLTDRYADLLHIHECLEQLAKMDERQSRIVELRFFGGLSIEETAEVEGISPMTVKREWAVARAWLLHQLGTAASSSCGES